MLNKVLLLLLLPFLLARCNSEDRFPNKFSDPVRLKIADLQDRRLADSLYSFFNHENPLYRMDAVQAFGSLQNATAVDRIDALLNEDPESGVRKSAAFALGQTQNPKCEQILLSALVKETHPEVIIEILEAYGKSTSQWQLDFRTQLNDSSKTSGLSWSLYRAGLRGKTDTLANRAATILLDKFYSEPTRKGAAHFFSRGASRFENAEKEIISILRNDPSAEVRMAAATSLAKLPSDSSLAALKSIIRKDLDSRVVTNAILSLRTFPYHKTKHYLYEALGHKDMNVGIAASEVVIQTITAEDWIEVSALTNHQGNWRIQSNLYAAALKAGQNRELAEEIKNAYGKSDNPYHKAALLHSLNSFPNAYTFVANKLTEETTQVLRSTAASTLVAMNQQVTFPKKLQKSFAEIFKDLLQTKDPAVVGIIATALADSTLGYRELLKDPAFLYEAKKKLKLPQDIEALQPIESAIAHFENRKESALKNGYNHPINWALVKTIPAAQLATIKTTKGNIIIRLFVEEAPGSVANFVALAKENYFDNKFVHRVVPNFVIQTGCDRGDGWGSEDYSIRSEFSARRYQGGSVGMASAGKDTEGTQWFITHSPTPHLDGRYTLFGEVQEGMKVVHYLQVGDKILGVVLETSPGQ
ncbi:MAG: peptidylprolyl isomerase [Cyclobacteriaceae bacterium]